VGERAKVGMIGLRGYGNIVRKGLIACEKLELAAVWSRSPESIERSQRELPSTVCDSYDALLAEPIDAVLIINPNYLHMQYALPAAEAGKAVLIEKPMTNTVAEGKEMVAAFKDKGLLLGVKHLQRFSPANRRIRDLIQAGDLGEVLSIETYTSHSSSKNFPPDRWKRDPKLCPAAPLTQLAVHYIDTAMSFFGPPTWVQSHHRNVLKLSENVDCTVTTVGFGEICGTFTAHYVVPSYARLAVYGSEGVLVEDHDGLRLKREGEKAFEPVDVPEGPSALVAVLDAFGESLLTGAPFETDGETGLQVVAAAEAAVTSAADGGRVVTIEEVMA